MDDLLEETSERMDQSVDAIRRELTGIRTGRASIAVLDGVTVSAYGDEMPLNQVANLAVPEPQLITVKPFDPTLLGEIEKAIQKADLGINPNNDGKLIRLPVPPLTEERRTQMARKVAEVAETGKTALRNIRRDANEQVKKLEKGGDVGADDAHAALGKIQALTDSHVKSLDDMAAAKTEELMTL